MTQERIRAFIAIELGQEAREALMEAVSALRQARLPGLRLVSPENTHLTLRFLGETEGNSVVGIAEALRQAAAGVPSFTLSLGKTGGFPSLKRPSVLWVGLTGDLEMLQGLYQGIEDALEGLGFPRERRAFTPHLTLARVRPGTRSGELARIGEAVERLEVRPVSLAVSEVALVRSELKPTGAVYTHLATARLG